MEESLKKFKDYLSQIIYSESSLSFFKRRICSTQGGPLAIFMAIDHRHLGSITSQDILAFCQRKGVSIHKKSPAVIGWFLGMGQQPVTCL
jgi:hypothetical protein